jgi:hypothetical protein
MTDLHQQGAIEMTRYKEAPSAIDQLKVYFRVSVDPAG